jgi:histidinol-phosphate/aromatic aminotransferase/cobyric acid decarboxylase-like protein
VHTPMSREALLARGFAVRRGGTFPGLDGSWMRVTVPSPEVAEHFVRVCHEVLREGNSAWQRH